MSGLRDEVLTCLGFSMGWETSKQRHQILMEVQATISRTDLTKLQTLGSIILLSFFEYWACTLRYLIRKISLHIRYIWAHKHIFRYSGLNWNATLASPTSCTSSEDEIISSVVISSSGLRIPFKTPPVAIKRILWTCLVISWSQAPLSRSKAKSDGFTLYLSVSQMLYRVAYVLFRQSSFNGFHVHRWQVVSSQSFRPHFDPITLFYISLSFEITWFNQQQGMEMRMCHHVAIIPPGYFSCSQKNLLPLT